MATTSRTKPSTPRLSEAARHLVIPKGIVKTGWPRVKAKAAELGIHYDPWQDGAHTITLGKRADGKYAATVGGVTWSIPRQVGKTYAIGTLLVVMCILFPGYKVIWTAHRTRTATDAFRAMQGICRRKKVAPHVSHIRTANGEQEIGFRNGSVILFGAREQGFGRGFAEIDVEVFDEAQILGSKALEDMIAATNQARHPHGALIFFIGTPPRPEDPSEAFTQKRVKALSGKLTNGVYLEFGADPDSDPDDRRQWPIMNPSHPLRTPLESMLRLRENLPSDDSWNREGRGVWDEIGQTHVFGPGAWEACAVDGLTPAADAIGLAVSVDRAWSSIGAAGQSGERLAVGIADRREGTGWLVPEAQRIQAERSCPVVIAGTGPAADMIPALEAAGVRLVIAKGNDAADACAGVFDAVRDKRLAHPEHPELNAAVAGAKQRKREDRWVWDRRNSAHDISPLEAVTLALWGANQASVDVWEVWT